MDTNNDNTSTSIYIRTNHPFVFNMITTALHADSTIFFDVKPAPGLPNQVFDEPGILILDCCSASQWPAIALLWRRLKWKIIALTPSGDADCQEELRALYFGISGVVSMSDNCTNNICDAVKLILNGNLRV